jgi:hypothetical protein
MEGTDTKKVRRGRKKAAEITEGQENIGTKTKESRVIEEAEIKPDITTESEQPEPKPKRARKKGKTSEDDIKSIQVLLQGIHSGLASLLKEPEFNINDNESAMLAKALSDAQNEFGISTNPKAMAVVNLVAVCAFIYIPRIKAIKDKNKLNKTNFGVKETVQKAQPKAATIDDITEALKNNTMRAPN